VSVFVDTSALLAVLSADDTEHAKAAATFGRLLERSAALVTTNYCVLETVALVQHRFGLPAVRSFHHDLLPVIDIAWIEAEDHAAGMMAMLTANRRELSLVDCTSFALMRRLGIRRAFHFDRHFREQGFQPPLAS
jgi:predicted nucleic acid-binding protein